MSDISLLPLRKALDSLASGYTDTPNDLERDGLIQRFEYTLELCWKVSKKVLSENGINIDVPKSIFKEMAQLGWIEQAGPWLDFIKARNKVSHIYHKEVAEEVFAVIPSFIEKTEKLLITLEKKIQ